MKSDFKNSKDEYQYYKHMVFLYPDKMYCYQHKNKKNIDDKYNYLAHSINLFNQQNNYPTHNIICNDSNSDDSLDTKYKNVKKKKNKIKLLTFTSLLAVSVVVANNYLSNN